MAAAERIIRGACRLAAFWGMALSTAISAAPAPPADGFTRGDDGTPYFRFAVDEEGLVGAPDRSFLNRPLDRSARLFVRDGHFFAAGPDGVPNTADDARVRLFGVNLAFASNFPDAADAPLLAKRLRRLGFNAVRLHHLDSLPGDDAQPPQSVLGSGPYPTFRADAVERLRTLVQALAAEGIYVNLNLHVGYRFRPAIDGVPEPRGPSGTAPVGAPLHVYHPRMIALQEQYARSLIRALGLRGKPALAMVEINNESSLLAAWQWRQWPHAVPPGYAPVLQQLWTAWLERRYGSLAKACAAWGSCATAEEASAMPSPVASGGGDSSLRRLQHRVARKFAGWWPGAAAASDADGVAPRGEAARRRDFLLFLADTDRRYLDRLRAVVHAETDELVPVAGTQMSYGGVLNFDSHVAMDYVDDHIYVGHPDFPSVDWNPRDWRIRDVAPSGGTEFDRLLHLAFRRDPRKPFVVSEFSQPFPNTRRAEMLPAVAAVASLQDWDGLFFFDYTFRARALEAPSVFSLSGDAGIYAMAGPSAQLFRTSMLPPLAARRDIPLPASARLAVAADEAFDAYEQFLARRGIPPADALRVRTGADLDPAASRGAAPALPTPTAALSLDAPQRMFQLQAPLVWGVFGDVGGRRIARGRFTLDFTGTAGSHAAVLVGSLDSQPLESSTRWLVTLAGAATGSQPGSRPPRPKELVAYRGDAGWRTLEPDPSAMQQPSGSAETAAPAWMRATPMRLQVRIPAGSHLAVYPLDGAGRRLPPASATTVIMAGETASVQLQADARSAAVWYECAIEPLAPPRPPT